MATQINLKVPTAIPVSSVDIEFEVRKNNELQGKVTISRGGIDWRRAHARKPVSLTWDQFAALMAERG
jgi:hypothetical protein